MMTALLMLLVGLVHLIVGVLLYAGRVRNVSPILQSDVVVFFGPALAAYIAYFLVAWHGISSSHRFWVRVFLAVIIAACGVIASELAKMFYAFGKYGT